MKELTEEEILTQLPYLCNLTPEGPHIIGDHVTIIRYYISASSPTEGYWLLTFYQAAMYFVKISTDQAAESGETVR